MQALPRLRGEEGEAVTCRCEQHGFLARCGCNGGRYLEEIIKKQSVVSKLDQSTLIEDTAEGVLPTSLEMLPAFLLLTLAGHDCHLRGHTMVSVVVQDSSTFQLILSLHRRVNMSIELLLGIDDQKAAYASS